MDSGTKFISGDASGLVEPPERGFLVQLTLETDAQYLRALMYSPMAQMVTSSSAFPSSVLAGRREATMCFCGRDADRDSLESVRCCCMRHGTNPRSSRARAG